MTAQEVKTEMVRGPILAATEPRIFQWFSGKGAGFQSGGTRAVVAAEKYAWQRGPPQAQAGLLRLYAGDAV